jgi:hypothetical protein
MRPASDLDESTILVGTPETTVTFDSSLFPQTYFTFEAGSNFNDCPYCEDYSSEISLELLQSEDFTQFFDNGASNRTEWATREMFVDKVSFSYLLLVVNRCCYCFTLVCCSFFQSKSYCLTILSFSFLINCFTSVKPR